MAGYLLQNNPNKPKVLMPDEWDPALMGDDEDDEADFINARLAAPTGNDGATKAEFDAMVEAAKADTGGAAPAQEFVYPDSKPTTPAVPAPPAPGSKPPSASGARPQSARPTSARPPSASAVPPAPLAPVPPPASSSRPASGSGRPPSATARPPSATPPPPPPAVKPEEADDPAQLDEAATKVQAAFRGYQARKEVAVMRSEAQPGEAAAEPEQQVELQPEAEPEPQPEAEQEPQPQASASSSFLPDGVTEEMAAEAATRVQAHMRGHLARKQVAAIKAQQAAPAVAESSEALAEPEPETQPEAEAEPQPQASVSSSFLPDGVTEEMAAEAATLVQAHMRGHLARKQVAAIKAQQAAPAVAESSEAQAEAEQTEAEAEPQPDTDAEAGAGEAEPEPEAGAGEAEPEPEAAE